MLPFSRSDFFAVFGHYNLTIWPAQVVAYALGILLLAAMLVRTRHAGRLCAGGLALFWAWNGIAYQILHFGAINQLAPFFGAVFVAQSAAFAYLGVIRNDFRPEFAGDIRSWLAFAMMLFALVFYSLLGLLLGHRWPETPIFGVAPCPTTIFTLGILIIDRGRFRKLLAVVPLAWSAVGGSAALLLTVQEDYSLLIAGVLVLAFLFLPAHRTTRRR
jgi:hypothetical protein